VSELRHSDEELVAGYFASFADGGGGPSFWAFEELTDMIRSDPERLWRLTITILRDASDPLYQAYVAAGPLEDLLRYHGERFIDRVESLAKSEPWFVECLRGVWASMTPDVRDRVRKLTNADA
jgi:hypothetical protein